MWKFAEFACMYHKFPMSDKIEKFLQVIYEFDIYGHPDRRVCILNVLKTIRRTDSTKKFTHTQVQQRSHNKSYFKFIRHSYWVSFFSLNIQQFLKLFIIKIYCNFFGKKFVHIQKKMFLLCCPETVYCNEYFSFRLSMTDSKESAEKTVNS